MPQTWDVSGGWVVDTQELGDRILADSAIEGITLLGGEPFLQADALADLSRRISSAGLSIVTFTGYRLEELLAADLREYNDLLRVTDLLIDGPFEISKADISRPWVGSSNQRYIFLTDRYAHLASNLTAIPNRLEIRIGLDGEIRINGLAAPAHIAHLIRDISDLRSN